ncbi:hypothetical protein BP00DRAFT_470507 [Aspergillus indologenus CBS 114.80]|uniref:Polyketide synthase n=1 Tax=Aspergillus indologenus CBS 114.80 TaxID=1450541 RepID=A0A2V5I9J6_9EURO|nr:hypothetical protein BP00DRAFT_470507 [Aspergillus indologenus CBS 114.80]
MTNPTSLQDGSLRDGTTNGLNKGKERRSHHPSHPAESGAPVPIAICGMGTRLPGGIRDEEALYDFLINGKDARSIVPPDRYNIDAYFSPHDKPGTVSTKHGYYLDVDLGCFDPSTFTITAPEAAQLDPIQRLILEVVREAFESAGEADWRDKKIGTYVGLFGEDWLDMRRKDPSFASPYDLLGALDYAIANRIAYEYDLKGPSVMVKTACSSAGIGLHEAMQEIQRGNITAAIVAGANLIFAPGMTVAMRVQSALSPEGSSKSFDATADGYARGEAVTALYIKRLDEAIRDGNAIRGVLRASASNADGRTPGFSAPSAAAHEAAIREAYSVAGLELSQTAMVEAHGTGTATGDPIEARAIAKCFGGSGVYLGAVKPNMGHSEGAAALTIPWEEGKLVVPVKPGPWPEDRAERMSVNSFGIGFRPVITDPLIEFILDSAASFGLGASMSIPLPMNVQTRKRRLLVFSAGLPEAVKAMTRISGDYLSKFSDHVLCYSDDKAVLMLAEYSQPICTALQVALVDLLAYWGVKPSAVVGHSSGEIAASYAAGTLTKSEAITIAFYRGHVCKDAPQKGGMAAVGVGKAQVARFILPGVSIACENSPSSVTLAGDPEVLEKVLADIQGKNEEVFVRRLQVEMAYHSDHMHPVGNRYHDLIAGRLDPRVPTVPFYSSVYGGRVLSEASYFGPHYWKDNLENPVLFHGAVKSMVREFPPMALVEVGPHSALRGALRQTMQSMSRSMFYTPTLTRGESDMESFLSAIGQLFIAGVDVRTPSSPLHAGVLPDLPKYPWHYEKRYWAESRVMHNWRFRKHLPHDLLGVRILEGTDLVPTWRNNLRLLNLPWLKDHRVGKDIVFPAAGYIAMAGAAILQLADSDVRDYTVRAVDLHQALILLDDFETEIVTTLRPQRLTSSLSSSWYELQIESYNGEIWKKHCSGLVRTGRASVPPAATEERAQIQALARRVSSSRWYETAARVGLNYGTRFTGLSNVTASVTEKKSAVEINDKSGTPSESNYPLHPASLDLAFQAWMVAIVQGDYRRFDHLLLPKFVGEVYVGNATGQTIYLYSTNSGPDLSGGHAYGVGADGTLLFYMKDPVLTRFEPDREARSELMAITMEWKPAFQFLDSGELTRPAYDTRNQLALAERLYVLCALESDFVLQSVPASQQPHLEKYRHWLQQQCARFAQPGYILVEDSLDLVKMSSPERRGIIPKALKECIAYGCESHGLAIWKTYDQLVNVFEGRVDFLDVMIRDGTLTSVYDWMNNALDISEFFQLLGHTQPQMRVLEIGAGTGGLTAKVLSNLRSAYGERLYLQYTFTDISSGFFSAAKTRFQEYEAIEYKVLDISKNPLEQGFQGEEYDLIIASNVLHATPCLHDTLVHVRSLLKPEGRLFLQELSPVFQSMAFVMGLFSGWWLGAADGRVDAPFISPEEWDARLRASGFDGCETVRLDNERPYHINANIVARPAKDFVYPKTMTLLSGPCSIHPLALKVEALLQGRGYLTQHRQPGDFLQQPLPEQDLMSFLDLDRPFLQSPSQADWDLFLQMVQTLQQNSVLWLSPLAQMDAQDPHEAMILGMTRTIRSELAMPLATLELESYDSLAAADAVVRVFMQLQQSKEAEAGELDPDMEFCWANGALHVGRYHWYPVKEALREALTEPETKALRVKKRGLLQSLYWSGDTLPELAADRVQIQTQAVGLNYKDVLIAMGVVDGGLTNIALGKEGAGYVTKVGAEVGHLQVGDRVLYLNNTTTSLATEAQTLGRIAVRVPDTLSFADAATMPAVYVTVLIALVDKARLERGQSILIHAAAGGIGIAAINVARWLGLEIYCTVGSEPKAAFLVREHGILRDRIFHSRDDSFRDNLMIATHGVGVDCVLNSLSGELLHASWECVAACGCLVEIGKRDMLGRGQLALDRFEDNRAYIGFDLTLSVLTAPAQVSRQMKRMLDLYADGHIRPIHPVTFYDAHDVQEAFRYMQTGSHIGKIVIRMPEETHNTLQWRPETPEPTFRPDRTYLLVGGMGGLGKAIATWMVTHDARHLIFLSRSAGVSENDQAFIHELKLRGCAVQAIAGDVADYETVQNVIDQAPNPIAGVMQMAMVLCDVGILNMTLEDYRIALRPKVDGTWNLHRALGPSNKDLDFFVLFSSVSGQIGYWGQANYAAANTFLDAFVQYRHARGLPASVQDIGAIDDVGFISHNPAVRSAMEAGSARLFTEQDFLDTLQLTMARSSHAPPCGTEPSGTAAGLGRVFQNPSQVCQVMESRLPITHADNHIIWKRDPRMAIYRNIETVTAQAENAPGGSSSMLKVFLAEISADPARLQQPAAAEFLAGELRDRVADFLMRRPEDGAEPFDLGLSLTEVGVDSLVAIELRNWWKQNLAVEVSAFELKNGGSMLDLGELAARRLREKVLGSGHRK